MSTPLDKRHTTDDVRKHCCLIQLRHDLTYIKGFNRKSRDNIKEARYITQSSIRSKNGGHVMLNLHKESKEHIYSFKLSEENIKHGPFSIEFDFQCKRVRNWHI